MANEKKEGLDLDQGVAGGTYSTVKIFHFPDKVVSLLERRVSAPIYVRVKPTNRCDHDCFYCLYDPKISGVHNDVDARDEIPRGKMMETLGDFGEMGVEAVTYSGGGEPLVYPHIIEAVRKTLDLGIGLSMITNAQNLRGEVAELMARAYWLRVSLDYCDPKMFSEIRRRPERLFNRIVENVSDFARIKREECDLGVNCVVHEKNYEHLPEIAKLCKEMGVGNVRFSPSWKMEYQEWHPPEMRKVVWEKIEEARGLEDGTFSVGSTYGRYFSGDEGEARNKGRSYTRCFWMEVVPSIGADQAVYTCPCGSYEPECRIGSIQNQSFKQMWFSPETERFFRDFNAQATCAEECQNDEKNMLLNAFVACQRRKV
ncbi:MAG: radical SAM protein, partial [Nanoarchaeota archaeon]